VLLRDDIMIKAGIIGASGYTGGELLRLLFTRDDVEVVQATSQRFLGLQIGHVHPNLRGLTELRFTTDEDIADCDVLLCGLPHGTTMSRMEGFLEKTEYVIDLSADFRLNSAEEYERWYGKPHASPHLLERFAYGIPELHRKEITELGCAAAPGCIASSIILALYPFRELANRVTVDTKIGSSAAGNSPSDSTHHPERHGVIRPYAPASHRHQAEVLQETGTDVMLTAHAVEMVRGISSTIHIELKEQLQEKDIWGTLRNAYQKEPFIRIVKSKKGVFRFPEPKILAGSNYCDIGFELDAEHGRLILFSALDNLVKGAAGAAMQCMNLIFCIEETKGLEFPGLHPV
jgi:N-acetyl-gamma-glutamyl-phosphate/LysW-gamma-L-alpha-aminoadipyl-6-phosphate reductase